MQLLWSGIMQLFVIDWFNHSAPSSVNVGSASRSLKQTHTLHLKAYVDPVDRMLIANILYHLLWMKPYEKRYVLHINWWKISSIITSTVGFLMFPNHDFLFTGCSHKLWGMPPILNNQLVDDMYKITSLTGTPGVPVCFWVGLEEVWRLSFFVDT